MGLVDLFKASSSTKGGAPSSGRCDRCAFCRQMPMFSGNGWQNVLVCEMSQRADGCVRTVRPDETCPKFRAQ